MSNAGSPLILVALLQVGELLSYEKRETTGSANLSTNTSATIQSEYDSGEYSMSIQKNVTGLYGENIANFSCFNIIQIFC